jgi:hypothetical protein
MVYGSFLLVKTWTRLSEAEDEDEVLLLLFLEGWVAVGRVDEEACFCDGGDEDDEGRRECSNLCNVMVKVWLC